MHPKALLNHTQTIHTSVIAGDPTLFGNLQPTDQIVEALVKSITSAKHNGYLPSMGLQSAREAVARYVTVPGAEIEGKV